jgi:hypothetical protein
MANGQAATEVIFDLMIIGFYMRELYRIAVFKDLKKVESAEKV